MRTVVVRGKVIRVAVVAGGALAATVGGVAVIVVIRRRRGGALAEAARRLPQGSRRTALPMARTAERWADRRAARVRKQRDEMVEMISAKIAENQAQAERKANPVWRKAASKGLETAATVGVAALVRRSFNEPMRRGATSVGTSQPETELVGAGTGQVSGATDGSNEEATPSRTSPGGTSG